MSTLLKLGTISFFILFSAHTVAGTNKTSRTLSAESVIYQYDANYHQLVSELVKASSESNRLLKFVANNFSSIKVKSKSVYEKRKLATEVSDIKSYSSCALDSEYGFSYDVQASWSTHNGKNTANISHQGQSPVWVLTSYTAKKRSSPCNT